MNTKNRTMIMKNIILIITGFLIAMLSLSSTYSWTLITNENVPSLFWQLFCFFTSFFLALIGSFAGMAIAIRSAFKLFE